MTEVSSSVIRETSEAAMRSNLYTFLLGAFSEMVIPPESKGLHK